MREKLIKINESIIRQVELIDLKINDQLEIIHNNKYINSNLYLKNYNQIHVLVKDLYFKDDSNIDIYHLCIIAIEEVTNPTNKSKLELLDLYMSNNDSFNL